MFGTEANRRYWFRFNCCDTSFGFIRIWSDYHYNKYDFFFLFWGIINFIWWVFVCVWKRKMETSVWESSKVHTMRHIESHTATNCHAQHAKILTDRSPWTSSVWLWYLSGFSMVGQIGDDVLKHLRSCTLLHPCKFRRRIRCSFAIHHFC